MPSTHTIKPRSRHNRGRCRLAPTDIAIDAARPAGLPGADIGHDPCIIEASKIEASKLAGMLAAERHRQGMFEEPQ
jgi:hypothetical protein